MNNTQKKPAAVELLLSDARGIYIPRDFVQDVLMLSEEDFIHGDEQTYFAESAILTLVKKWSLEGYASALFECLNPDGEWYWEAWQAILENAKHTEYGHTLYQDGDVFALNISAMTSDELRNFELDEEVIEERQTARKGAKCMNEHITPEQLANAFIAVLHDWLTADELSTIDERNTAESDSLVCHSHDFCDANVAMENALINLGITPLYPSDEPDNAAMQAQTDLWNTAWDIAKARGFSTRA